MVSNKGPICPDISACDSTNVTISRRSCGRLHALILGAAKNLTTSPPPTRVYTPPTSHFLFNLTSPYFYEYPTNSNCVSVSRGTFQPRRFSRQSLGRRETGGRRASRRTTKRPAPAKPSIVARHLPNRTAQFSIFNFRISIFRLF